MTAAKPETQKPATSPGTAPAPMFTDTQLRRLKIAVIVMGLILVLGFLLVIGRIIYLVNRMDPPANVARQDTSRSPRAPAPDLSLALPTGALVRNVSISGDRLAVHYEAPAGGGLVLLDAGSGQVIRRILLIPEGGAR
jgi:hypothetical protein